MRISRLFLAIAASLTLASCGLAAPPANLLPPAPVEVANKTTLDERIGLGAETAYAAAAQAIVFKHMLSPFSPEDLAKVKALDEQAKAALQVVRSAYKAANSEDYRKAYDEVMRISAEIVKAVSS